MAFYCKVTNFLYTFYSDGVKISGFFANFAGRINNAIILL